MRLEEALVDGVRVERVDHIVRQLDEVRGPHAQQLEALVAVVGVVAAAAQRRRVRDARVVQRGASSASGCAHRACQRRHIALMAVLAQGSPEGQAAW